MRQTLKSSQISKIIIFINISLSFYHLSINPSIYPSIDPSTHPTPTTHPPIHPSIHSTNFSPAVWGCADSALEPCLCPPWNAPLQCIGHHPGHVWEVGCGQVHSHVWTPIPRVKWTWPEEDGEEHGQYDVPTIAQGRVPVPEP